MKTPIKPYNLQADFNAAFRYNDPALINDSIGSLDGITSLTAGLAAIQNGVTLAGSVNWQSAQNAWLMTGTGLDTMALGATSDGVGIQSYNGPFLLNQNGNDVKIGTTGAESNVAIRGGLDFLRQTNQIVVIDGDSISESTIVGYRNNWPNQMGHLSATFGRATVTNDAYGGKLAAEVLADFTASGNGHDRRPQRTADVAWYIVMVGINDVGQQTPALTIYNTIKTIWAAARADGYRVVASTLFPVSTYTPGTTRGDIQIALNNYIRSDPTLYDYLVRAHTLLPDGGNTTYFPDGTHPSPAGSLIQARFIADILDRRSTPWDLVPIAYNAGPADIVLGAKGERVGIGVEPSEKLTVAGNFKLSTGGSIIGDNAGVKLLLSQTNGTQLTYTGSSLNLYGSLAELDATSALSFKIGGVEQYRITNDYFYGDHPSVSLSMTQASGTLLTYGDSSYNLYGSLAEVNTTANFSVKVGAVEKFKVNATGPVTSSDIEITDFTKGVILKSPDGTRYRITVPNGGASLTITPL